MLTITPTSVLIPLRVHPRGARDRVAGVQGGVLKVHVTALPVDGAANRAVVELLANWLGVPRRSVTVVRGQSGRDKMIAVASDDPAALARRITACVDIPQGAD